MLFSAWLGGVGCWLRLGGAILFADLFAFVVRMGNRKLKESGKTEKEKRKETEEGKRKKGRKEGKDKELEIKEGKRK